MEWSNKEIEEERREPKLTLQDGEGRQRELGKIGNARQHALRVLCGNEGAACARSAQEIGAGRPFGDSVGPRAKVAAATQSNSEIDSRFLDRYVDP